MSIQFIRSPQEAPDRGKSSTGSEIQRNLVLGHVQAHSSSSCTCRLTREASSTSAIDLLVNGTCV